MTFVFFLLVGVEAPLIGVVLPEFPLAVPFNPFPDSSLSLVGEFAPEPIELRLRLYGANEGDVRLVLKIKPIKELFNSYLSHLITDNFP